MRRPKSTPPLRVALLIETSNAYARELLHGIRAYARAHGHWALHLTEQGRGATPPAWLRSWRGEGIIARIETAAMARAVRQCGRPVVNVSAAGLAPEFPTVISDSAAIARLAAQHLIERGFKHFGYCGDARFAWSDRHGRNFAAAVKAAGLECSEFAAHPEDARNWEQERRKLARWLQYLPKPAGVMACYDIRAQQVLDVCRTLGVAVPDDVAVIGQHNDELLCELCDPPLSSVRPNARRAGQEAAALLELLVRGDPSPPRVVLVEPVGVVTRQSTDVVAVDDARLAAAVRFIREQACVRIGVEDARRIAAMSRTLFERRFRQMLGRTPYEEILKVRLAKARELLAVTDLPIAEIAGRAGFASPEYFSTVVRKHLRTTPRALRRRLRQEH